MNKEQIKEMNNEKVNDEKLTSDQTREIYKKTNKQHADQSNNLNN